MRACRFCVTRDVRKSTARFTGVEWGARVSCLYVGVVGH